MNVVLLWTDGEFGETVLFQTEFETLLSHETSPGVVLDKPPMAANYGFAMHCFFLGEN